MRRRIRIIVLKSENFQTETKEDLSLVVKTSNKVKMALKRINKELQDMGRNPLDYISAKQVGNDLFHWEATIKGPKKTPYKVFWVTYPSAHR